MEMLKSCSRSAFQSFRRSQPPIDQPEPPTFHPFSRLPPELRVKIWRLAIAPRILPLHIHPGRAASYAPDILNYHHSPDSEDSQLQAWNRHPWTAYVTVCSLKNPCGCRYYPLSSANSIPTPSILLACRESREAVIENYVLRFNRTYNHYGMPLTLPTVAGGEPYSQPTPGLSLSPSLDIPLLKVDIANSQTIETLHRFVKIASKEAPLISRVAIIAQIALPPYLWRLKSRFEKWKRWGDDGSWVPRNVVQFENFEEVIIVVRGKEVEKLLPEEWRVRTLAIWEREMEVMRERWPVQWEGKMPSLRFVGRVEDIPGELSKTLYDPPPRRGRF